MDSIGKYKAVEIRVVAALAGIRVVLGLIKSTIPMLHCPSHQASSALLPHLSHLKKGMIKQFLL